MKGKRQRLQRTLQNLGLATIMGRLLTRLRPALTVLTYHRILDVDDTFTFDAELVSATPGEFERQLLWLKKNCTLVNFAQWLSISRGDQPIPRRPVIITFDDGYSDNYVNAFPILKRLSAPATFFVSTGYVGTERIFWFDWLAHRVLNPDYTELELTSLDLHLKLPEDRQLRRGLCADLLITAKRAPLETQKLLIEELQNDQISRHSKYRMHSELMNWQQIREMSQAGMEFGSHGVEHLMLAKLNDHELLNELSSSQCCLETQIDQKVRSIAYPVGSPDACDERVFSAALATGYEFGCVYKSGVNHISNMNPLALNRVTVDRQLNEVDIACAVNLQDAFGY